MNNERTGETDKERKTERRQKQRNEGRQRNKRRGNGREKNGRNWGGKDRQSGGTRKYIKHQKKTQRTNIKDNQGDTKGRAQ